MSDGRKQTFDLRLPRLNVDARWRPTEPERELCTEIVARIDYRILPRDADPSSRFATLVKSINDAMAVVYHARPEARRITGDSYDPDSLFPITASAKIEITAPLEWGIFPDLDDGVIGGQADKFEPDVVEYRRAVGMAAGASEAFWTPADTTAAERWTFEGRRIVSIAASTQTLADTSDSRSLGWRRLFRR